MARARRTDDRLRGANRRLAGRLVERDSPPSGVPSPAEVRGSSPEFALGLEVAQGMPFDVLGDPAHVESKTVPFLRPDAVSIALGVLRSTNSPTSWCGDAGTPGTTRWAGREPLHV